MSNPSQASRRSGEPEPAPSDLPSATQHDAPSSTPVPTREPIPPDALPAASPLSQQRHQQRARAPVLGGLAWAALLVAAIVLLAWLLTLPHGAG